MGKIKILSSNQLKILACITMLIDHIGYFILPQLTILRLIGRLTFPIFAFLISEGTKYTKNKLRYLLTVGILGVVWQIYLIIFRSDYHFNVLITFSISIIIIYAMDYFKKCLFDKNCKVIFKILTFLLFAFVALSPYLIAKVFSWFHYEYGFYGAMCAVFASAPVLNKTDAPDFLKWFDKIPIRALCMAIPLFMYCRNGGIVILFYFIGLALTLLYSEKRGKANLKYFFYIFYPAHLLILHLISYLI